MKDFSFRLFGVDYLPTERAYGIYFCGIDRKYDGSDKHLLSLYSMQGTFLIDIFFYRFEVS